ncbi:hypothetical protein [Haloplanus halophilus]|uniref:hypothetical protein n=1 Tax=Haloplanus halophilus TaxID=2949993 RepID=UPI00203D8BD1|nr:hypothetical protein [Haloplanus sp. GDY1]
MSSRPLPLSQPPRIVRTVAVFALGLLLVANGLYLYPAGNPAERVSVYEAREVGDAAPGALPDDAVEGVLDCNYVAVESRDCALVRYVRTEGPLRVETDADVDGRAADHRFVAANGSVFRPTARVEGDTLVLGLDRVPPERARRALATAYGDASPAARTAIEEGRVRTTASVGERYVAHEGTYYVLSRVRTVEETRRWGIESPPPAQVALLRLVGWLGGLALVWTAGRRAS